MVDLQLPLLEASQEFLTITTHMGLYRFNRMPFGVASAPAIFEHTMETITGPSRSSCVPGCYPHH